MRIYKCDNIQRVLAYLQESKLNTTESDFLRSPVESNRILSNPSKSYTPKMHLPTSIPRLTLALQCIIILSSIAHAHQDQDQDVIRESRRGGGGREGFDEVEDEHPRIPLPSYHYGAEVLVECLDRDV